MSEWTEPEPEYALITMVVEEQNLERRTEKETIHKLEETLISIVILVARHWALLLTTNYDSKRRENL